MKYFRDRECWVMTSLSNLTEEVVSPLSSLEGTLTARLGDLEDNKQEEILKGLSDVEEEDTEEGSRMIVVNLTDNLRPQTTHFKPISATCTILHYNHRLTRPGSWTTSPWSGTSWPTSWPSPPSPWARRSCSVSPPCWWGSSRGRVWGLSGHPSRHECTDLRSPPTSWTRTPSCTSRWGGESCYEEDGNCALLSPRVGGGWRVKIFVGFWAI